MITLEHNDKTQQSAGPYRYRAVEHANCDYEKPWRVRVKLESRGPGDCLESLLLLLFAAFLGVAGPGFEPGTP